MLLDRLMVALHHALEDEDPKEIKKINDLYRNGQLPLPTQINPNLAPKYFGNKGKSASDAYYGYKLVNGQAGELIYKLIRCLIGVEDIQIQKLQITKLKSLSHCSRKSRMSFDVTHESIACHSLSV